MTTPGMYSELVHVLLVGLYEDKTRGLFNKSHAYEPLPKLVSYDTNFGKCLQAPSLVNRPQVCTGTSTVKYAYGETPGMNKFES